MKNIVDSFVKSKATVLYINLFLLFFDKIAYSAYLEIWPSISKFNFFDIKST
jgi:hypothetical protein